MISCSSFLVIPQNAVIVIPYKDNSPPDTGKTVIQSLLSHKLAPLIYRFKIKIAFFTIENKPKKMIAVCCAIILKNSKILAVQRGVESSHPNQWEFPGGKIHANETAEQCIIREIEEE
jgi:8-oxo-dGTP pyrophosphatase MutT (NUDIX family)